MKISELMSEDVEMAASHMMLDEAADLMRSADVGALPVVDGGQLLGVITDRDIVVRAIADGDDPARTTVKAVMTADVTVIFEDQTVEEAARLMGAHQIRRLPVLDRDQRVVGMVSLGSLSLNSEAPVLDTLRAVSEESSRVALRYG